MTSYPTTVAHPAPVNAPQQQQPGATGNPVAHATGGGGDSYFTETRKGEVNELRALLRNFSTERNPQKKRDVIKKVIAYMTLGIDVSRLFTEMMLAIETRDLVIKKMVYLFLCNYATSHPELAQMCINTLQKDCSNEDPLVRGLALRSLTSLNLPLLLEYICEPLQRSLSDHHAYVRKTAVMGVLKLWNLDRDLCKNYNFIDTLYDMLRDNDPIVATNCIFVLNEMMMDEGGMAINRAIILHLLNRLHEFSEFGVTAVLNLVPRYKVASAEEAYQIMNLLDPMLRTNNSGTVLCIIKCFFALTKQIENEKLTLQRQVVERIKAPLVTLVAGGTPELVFCLLKHIDVLVQRFPGVFDDEYRQFYIRYNEPTHLKYLKVKILAQISNVHNAPEIITELCEYMADINMKLCTIAIQSMARIACSNAGGDWGSEHIVLKLVESLDLNISHVSSEAANALKDIVRKNPDLKKYIAPPLPRALKFTKDAAGKASIIWLIGECGEASLIKDAPYVLERLIDTYDEIESPSVKMALLTSTMKLFFKRSPEIHRMLGRLLRYATDDVSSQELHDRALFYFRLLRSNVKRAENIIFNNKINNNNSAVIIPKDKSYAEDNDGVNEEALMVEFDTLAIVYGQTSENFISEEHYVRMVMMNGEDSVIPSASSDLFGSGTNNNSISAGGGMVSGNGNAPMTVSTAGTVSDDLLDFLGGGGSATEQHPSSNENGLMMVTNNPLLLDPTMTMTGDVYQTKWGAIADQADSTIGPLEKLPNNIMDVESGLKSVNIMTMASGELPNEFKFFLYAKDSVTQSIFLLQVLISKTTQSVSVTSKMDVEGGDGDDTGVAFSDHHLVDKLKVGLSAFLH